MIKIFKYFKSNEWLQVLICVILIVVQVWLDLKLPDYMAEITKLVQTAGSAMKDIWISGGYMLLCAVRKSCKCYYCWLFCSKNCSIFFTKTSQQIV